jgi:hypothetical protein
MTIAEQTQEAPKDDTANRSLLSTADFLREHFRGAEGKVFFCCYRNTDSKLAKGELGKIITRDPNAVSKFIAERDKREHENGVYFSTATYKPEVISRDGENCLQFVSLFADVDDKNHGISRDMALALLENTESPPTLIVSSGHGLQPYWLLSEPIEDRERIEVARKKLQALTASDAVHDAARIMRLPGTHNSKLGDWCEVEVVSYRPEYRYTPEALEDWLDRAPIIIPRKPEPEQEQQANGHAHNGHQFHNDGPADVERIHDALRYIPAHDREVWYKIGMALKDEMGDSGFGIWDEWSRSSNKYDAKDQQAKWKSFKREGVGIGTLFEYAKQYGWDSRQNKSGRANGFDAGTPKREKQLSLEDFFCYMAMPNAYIFRPTREIWPASSVNARIAPIPTGKEDEEITASRWLGCNRPVEQLTWAPGLPELIQDRIISDGGWINRPGSDCYNQYRGPTIELGNAAEAGPWLEHTKTVFPDDADHLVKWFAHRVQKPGDKINHALVLGGLQGIGKDTILEPVKRAIGPWNWAEVSPQAIQRRFNAYLKSVVLRISEARDLGDINRYQFYDHMKSYTAAPPDVLRVDEKHIREHSVLNCTGIIITTNHKSDGIFLPQDDRRHYVAWSERSRTDFSEGYWRELWGWYNKGGFGHVAAYLAKFDLSSFDPKQPPPKTDAFWSIVHANQAPEEAELMDLIDRLGNPDALTPSQLHARADLELQIWLGDRKNRRALPHRLESCGYSSVPNPDAKDTLWKAFGSRQTVYAKSTMSVRDRIAAVRRFSSGG